MLINSAAIRKKDLVVVDGDLNVVEDAKITVIDMRTGSYALIYNPNNEDELISNPFVSDSTGQFAFYVDTGVYKIGVVTQTDTEELEGSVIISATSNERYYIRPEDFGAKGGANDDTQAFTLAINEQRDTGLPIYLERPLYTSDINTVPNDKLVMYSNVKFTTIKTLNTTNFDDLDLIQISNLTFDFENNPTGTNGINISKTSDIRINNAIFKNARRTNVAINDCSNFIIESCEFNDAGLDEYVTPGGVTIGCGLILESCKNDGQNPTVVKDCVSLRPWQIGFFVYNSDNTTESYGNVINGCMVFGARDNGIRTQTQGTPFDPFRCRDHIVKGCYVAGSHIDNYRVNGGGNTFVDNISYTATGYGFKSDGGSNNIINNNHDNGSLVAAGLRIGADTINYSISGNTSLNCKGLGGAFYGVVVEDNLNIKGINCSNNTVMSMENPDCSPFSFVVTPGNLNSRFKQLSVSNNYSSSSEKQALDIAQADSPFVSCNAFFDNCNTVNAPVVTLSDTSSSFGSGNLLQGKLDGTTSFAIEFKNGSNNNKWASNYMMNFNYDPAFNDFDTNNQINQTFTDFNDLTSLYTVANTSSLGSRLTKNIDVDVIANRATGQESALDVLGIFVTYIADKQDGALGQYTRYSNV